MTPEQLQAACGESTALGLRSVVHAHSAESAQRAARAGCTQVEHGVFADDTTLALFAERGTWFDPQCGLVFRNYLDHKPWFDGIGNYNAVGFAAMEKAIPLAEAGIAVGERIVRFQGEDPGSASAFVRRIGTRLKPGDEVRLSILSSEGRERENH